MKPMKKPIASSPPTPPRIYKVNPVNFKKVVQKLTSATEFHLTRLQEVAVSLSPPWQQPLVHPNEVTTPSGSKFSDFMIETDEKKVVKPLDYSFGALTPPGFNFSPSSLAWFSSLLSSPRALPPLESSAVL